jgi:hypothetical protein
MMEPISMVPLTRIANRIAKGNSGKSDLSPKGEEIAGRRRRPLLPGGEKVAAKRPGEPFFERA